MDDIKDDKQNENNFPAKTAEKLSQSQPVATPTNANVHFKINNDDQLKGISIENAQQLMQSIQSINSILAFVQKSDEHMHEEVATSSRANAVTGDIAGGSAQATISDSSTSTIPYGKPLPKANTDCQKPTLSGKRKVGPAIVSMPKKKKAAKKQLSSDSEGDFLNDNVSIPGESDMDERIKDLCASDNDAAQVLDNEETIFFKDLANVLEPEAVEGPPVNEKLAEVFNGLCTKPLSKEKIAYKLEQYPTPSNCKLITRKCNPLIWKDLLDTKHRSFDIKLQKSQNSIVSASNAILRATDLLVKAKHNTEVTKKDMKSLMSDSIRSLTDSLAILTNAHSYSEQMRRDCLGSVLASEQKRLVHNVPNESILLFGDDLPKRIADIKATNNLLIKPKTNLNFSGKNGNRFSKVPENRKNYGHYQQAKNYSKNYQQQQQQQYPRKKYNYKKKN